MFLKTIMWITYRSWLQFEQIPEGRVYTHAKILSPQILLSDHDAPWMLKTLIIMLGSTNFLFRCNDSSSKVVACFWSFLISGFFVRKASPTFSYMNALLFFVKYLNSFFHVVILLDDFHSFIPMEVIYIFCICISYLLKPKEISS